jgi:hypothetical protein
MNVYEWMSYECPDEVHIQLFQLRLSTRAKRKSRIYERERLLGIANKLMNFQSDSQQPFALVFDFSALLVDNLNGPFAL